MVCTECRDNDHGNCDDTKHPEQDYRGCPCQHMPRRTAEANTVSTSFDPNHEERTED